MEYARKPTVRNRNQSAAPQLERRALPDDLALQREAQLRAQITRLTFRSPAVQRQQATSVLRALSLHALEGSRVDRQRQALRRQMAHLGPVTPTQVAEALQRQARRDHLTPAPVRPQTPAEWVTVMRHQAAATEGQPLSPRAAAQFTGLQRQVAHALAQGFRADRGPAAARHEQYGTHLAVLQQHVLSAPVVTAVLGLVPPSERLSLQRASRATTQREAEQRAQDAEVLHAATLQRHLAESDAEATQPVLQRIQARRGAGSPLPDAIRRHFEQGLNHDLSRVRIHDDVEADRLAKGVHALAFTTGADIFFRSGQLNLNTSSGLELLAHEVTHIVQQSQGRVGPGVDPDASLETEAREKGRELARTRLTTSSPALRKMNHRAPLTVGHAVQRQAAGGGGSKVIQVLTKAIGAGDLEKALTLLKGMKREQQAQAMMEMMRHFRGQMGPGVAEGLQAMIDGLSKWIPDVIRKTVKKPINPGPWSPPGKQPIPYYIGTSAHNAIAQHYETVHAAEQVFTNMRPMSTILGRAAGKLTAAEKILKPDIVNMDRRHLYEIKSRSQAGLAVSEAAMYLALFRKAGVKMDLGPVNDPGVIGIIPAPGGITLSRRLLQVPSFTTTAKDAMTRRPCLPLLLFPYWHQSGNPRGPLCLPRSCRRPVTRPLWRRCQS